MKILVLANHFNTLRIFRKDLLSSLVNGGNKVICAFPFKDDEDGSGVEFIKSLGCEVLDHDMDRRSMNPIKDIKLLKLYRNLLTELQPDVVLTFTIKCNVYGSLACRKKKIPCYSFVTGLGSMIENGGIKKLIALFLYKISLKKTKKVFFENQGNKELFVNNNIIKEKQAVALPGAGVNLTDFYFTEYPSTDNGIRFLFIGRIMKEKGVDELFGAIKRIKSEFSNTTFSFVGWFEENYKEQVEELSKNGFIEFLGFKSDVKPFIENCHCLLLPSYHEGMNNALLESAAMGRPLITTDVYGCKEAVIDGENGFICEVKSEESLYQSIKKFILLSPEEKKSMGEKSRKHVEKVFDKMKVVEKTIKEFDF